MTAMVGLMGLILMGQLVINLALLFWFPNLLLFRIGLGPERVVMGGGHGLHSALQPSDSV
ncbi:MAG: hypothetical protein VKN56_10505 [Cyanobacteriota bacterium]|nr:hypothetical protein [Cyanobacteriota bacterium]